MIKGRLAVTRAPPSPSGLEMPNVFVAALTAPGYSVEDAYSVCDAFGFSYETLFRELMVYAARRLETKLDVPLFILQGDSDLQSPAPLRPSVAPLQSWPMFSSVLY